MTEHPSTEDQQMTQAMRALDPRADEVSSVRAKVLARYSILHRPLALEWVAMIRQRPLINTAWALAAAVVLVASTPLGGTAWLAFQAVAASAIELAAQGEATRWAMAGRPEAALARAVPDHK